jgi:hypothetical protein
MMVVASRTAMPPGARRSVLRPACRRSLSWRCHRHSCGQGAGVRDDPHTRVAADTRNRGDRGVRQVGCTRCNSRLSQAATAGRAGPRGRRRQRVRRAGDHGVRLGRTGTERGASGVGQPATPHSLPGRPGWSRGVDRLGLRRAVRDRQRPQSLAGVGAIHRRLRRRGRPARDLGQTGQRPWVLRRRGRELRPADDGDLVPSSSRCGPVGCPPARPVARGGSPCRELPSPAEPAAPRDSG